MTDDQLRRLRELVDAGLSDASIAREFGVDPRTVLRWRGRYGLESKWQAPVPPHGSRARYSRPHRCRCDDCRAANTAAQSDYVARLNAATPASRRYLPWTAAEDAVLLDEQRGTVYQRARLIGRSYGAARQRLDDLRR